uniref:Uncharacterized protein n=1 Tax=Anopheles dirus TaxID=7168 RepID=A0A1Y9H2N3_9DIPT
MGELKNDTTLRQVYTAWNTVAQTQWRTDNLNIIERRHTKESIVRKCEIKKHFPTSLFDGNRSECSCLEARQLIHQQG